MTTNENRSDTPSENDEILNLIIDRSRRISQERRGRKKIFLEKLESHLQGKKIVLINKDL